MRVGIVTETCSPEINGVALTVAGLVRGLAEAGLGVQLIRPRQLAEAAATGHDDGVETTLVRGMRLPRYPGLQFGLPAARRLRALWDRDALAAMGKAACTAVAGLSARSVTSSFARALAALTGDATGATNEPGTTPGMQPAAVNDADPRSLARGAT
jgi:hypothetical protein